MPVTNNCQSLASRMERMTIEKINLNKSYVAKLELEPAALGSAVRQALTELWELWSRTNIEFVLGPVVQN